MGDFQTHLAKGLSNTARRKNFDMDDTPEIESGVCSDHLREALKFLGTELSEQWHKSDAEAIGHQKKHRKLALTGSLIGHIWAGCPVRRLASSISCRKLGSTHGLPGFLCSCTPQFTGVECAQKRSLRLLELLVGQTI